MATNTPLWLCLYLPQLSLDRYKRSHNDDKQALVIVQGLGAQQHITAANAAAVQQGIQVGMKLTAAHSLCDNLITQAQDHDAEQQEIQSLALWSMQYTSIVSLCPPQSLLLEIRGSLHLFGGINSLLTQINVDIEQLGYQLRTAIAPTPLAAQLFAADQQQYALDIAQLKNQLMPLPINRLGLENKTQTKLLKLGLKQCRDILRLPQHGLQQRYGEELLPHLHKLLGDIPDPRTNFVPPEIFQRQIELPVAVSNTEALIFVGQRLLQELHGFLISRCAATQHLHWQLFHENQPATHFTLSLVSAGNNSEHLRGLLKERLERLNLPAKVISIDLEVNDIQLQENNSKALFHNHADHASTSWQALVEKLIARLGENSVSGLDCQPDHRPEHSQIFTPPGQGKNIPVNIDRPAWLLRQPQALEIRQQQLWRQGPLDILSGPERIEGGWWDGQDIRRDYFRAQDPQGKQLWVFREKRVNERWFLHGFFH
jgi:protein ImuB